MVALQAAFAVALYIGATDVMVITGSKAPVDGAVVRVTTKTDKDPAVPVGNPLLTDAKGIADIGALTGLIAVTAIARKGTMSGAAPIINNGSGFPPRTPIEISDRPFVPLPPPK